MIDDMTATGGTLSAAAKMCRDNGAKSVHAFVSHFPLTEKGVERLMKEVQLDELVVTDSIPLRFFESVGYDRNVVVLTQPKNYVKQPNRLMPLIRVALRQYPATVRALANRHLRYRKQVRQVWDDVAAGRALVIQPDAPLEIHSVEHDESVMQRAYEEGRKAAEGQLEAVREFLGDEKA